jgi:hypothetical protein
MPKNPNSSDKEPAEGSRETIEHELNRGAEQATRRKPKQRPSKSAPGRR